MAKQKDRGDVLEIYFEKGRDSRRKFQKFIRNAVAHERKHIVVDMVKSKPLPRDYLASVVFGAQALKSHGYTVTFVLAPDNYRVLSTSEHATHFKFEIAQIISDEEIQEASQENKFLEQYHGNSSICVEGNKIFVADEGTERLPGELPKLISALKQNYQEIILDLTQVFLLTPQMIQAFILETLNSGNALKIIMQDTMQEVLESNPQTLVLNVEYVDESYLEPTIPSSQPEKTPVSPISAPKASSMPEPKTATISELTTPLMENLDSFEIPEGTFKAEVNCLRVGRMNSRQFKAEFLKQFRRLFDCGNHIVVDMRECGAINLEIVIEIMQANFVALQKGKTVEVKLLKEQKAMLDEFFPKLTEAEPAKDTRPRFNLVGSRLELYNITPELFRDKFAENFRRLLACGQKKLVVDISHLEVLVEQEVELMVLSYLEATGRGLAVTMRISPEMEELFIKSGRGRMLPLEIIRPELGTKDSIFEGTAKSLDMSKIRDALEQDKLSEKVLKKQYNAVHIESRGSVHNWDPSPTKNEERVVDYKGPERRKDRRYKTRSTEVSFAKGTLGKITGRRYPMHNISQSGACFTTGVSVNRSEPVRLKIFHDEISIELPAKVIWSSPIASQVFLKWECNFPRLAMSPKYSYKLYCPKYTRKQRNEKNMPGVRKKKRPVTKKPKKTVYDTRRDRLIKLLPKQSLVIVTAGTLNHISREIFSPDRNFLYLTGLDEPETVAVLNFTGKKTEYILYWNEPDQRELVWDGPRMNLRQLQVATHADKVYPRSLFENHLADYLAGAEHLVIGLGAEESFDHKVLSTRRRVIKSKEVIGNAAGNILDINKPLEELRLRKDSHEINTLKKAISITAQAYRQAMAQTKPRLYEYEIEVLLYYEFRRKGAQGTAFPSIVAAGVNGTVLHYTRNDSRIKKNDLLLVDSGAKYQNYSADVTRTWPVSGKFSPAQKSIYQAVLDAQKYIISTIKPGMRMVDVHGQTVEMLTESLVNLGLLSGKIDRLISQKQYQKFYPHNTSHWLGLDVHDIGKYYDNEGKDRILEPGMVLTIEPGLYIPANASDKFGGIAVRIEDDVLVTAQGCEVLTRAIPKEIEEIEKIVGLDRR